MKKGKKLLALTMIAALSTSMFGCSSNGSDKNKNASTGTNSNKQENTDSKANGTSTDTGSDGTEDRFAEPMEISIAVWNIGDAITDTDDAVLKTIYDKFNITIKPYAVTWGDYAEKITLWAAAGNLPDMTAYEAGYTSTYTDWTTQGVVRALPSDLSLYPNVAAQVYSDGGKAVNCVTDSDTNPTYYAVPRPQVKNVEETMLDYGIFLRKDWMEAVGVTEVPDNVDDLISLLQKFQTEDPDGNGIDDTIGLTGYSFRWMSGVMTGTCTPSINGLRWVYAEDGSIEPVWKNESFLEGMKVMKKFYDAGVLDPDYIILKGEEGRDKFKNGQAGAYVHSGPTLAALQIMESAFATKYPDKAFEDLLVSVPLFNDKDGHPEYVQGETFWSETYLSKNVSDEKADRCLALLDFLLSDEGYELVSLGIEGVDYTKDADGNITLIDRLDSEGNVMSMNDKYPSSRLQGLANWTGYRSASSPAYSDTIKKMSSDYMADMNARGIQPVKLPNTNGVVLEDTKSLDIAGGEMEKIFNDLMTADDIEAAWKAMVDKYMKSGYDQVIEEMNTLYKATGRN